MLEIGLISSWFSLSGTILRCCINICLALKEKNPLILLNCKLNLFALCGKLLISLHPHHLLLRHHHFVILALPNPICSLVVVYFLFQTLQLRILLQPHRLAEFHQFSLLLLAVYPVIICGQLKLVQFIKYWQYQFKLQLDLCKKFKNLIGDGMTK